MPSNEERERIERALAATDAEETAEEDDSPVSDEALRAVIEGLGRVAASEGFGDMLLKPADPQSLEELADSIANTLKEEGLSVSPEEVAMMKRSLSEVGETVANYEPEMAIDAKEIAKALSAQTGLPVTLHLHHGGKTETVEAGETLDMLKPDVPKPTLGSLREHAAAVARSFASSITALLPTRKKTREEGGVRALILYHHTGKADALRQFATREKNVGHLLVQLEDAELMELTAVNVQHNVLCASGLGIYTGALLAHAGFTIDEIVDCASDSVFVSQVIGMRAGPKDVTKLALEVTSEVHQARQNRQRKTLD
jgi:hypothetical protein